MMDCLGKLIVIEGNDGSGKTVQSRRLYQRLLDLKIPIYITTEPTERPIGRLIRNEYLSGNTKMDSKVAAMLYAADRLDHVTNEDDGILAKIHNGVNVISDRYYISSLAYQGSMAPMDFVIKSNEYVMDNLRPNITIFLSLDPISALNRINARNGNLEIFETLDYQRKIYESYLNVINILRSKGENIKIIDGSGTMDKISDLIWESVKHLFID